MVSIASSSDGALANGRGADVYNGFLQKREGKIVAKKVGARILLLDSYI